MLKQVSDIKEITYILDHIRENDKEELKALYGKNWYKKTLKILSDEKFLVLYGINDNNEIVPVSIGGCCGVLDKTPKTGCIWLLSTYYTVKNKTILVKVIKEQVEKAKQEYDIIYNYIYKTNVQIKSLLKKLGFCFDNPKPEGLKLKDGFEFFYLLAKKKGDKNVFSG